MGHLDPSQLAVLAKAGVTQIERLRRTPGWNQGQMTLTRPVGRRMVQARDDGEPYRGVAAYRHGRA